jgi:hypothetical protein
MVADVISILHFEQLAMLTFPIYSKLGSLWHLLMLSSGEELARSGGNFWACIDTFHFLVSK